VATAGQTSFCLPTFVPSIWSISIDSFGYGYPVQVPRHPLETYRFQAVPACNLLTYTINCDSNILLCCAGFTFSVKKDTYAVAGGPSGYLAQLQKLDR
jgi:hypothetical protein